MFKSVIPRRLTLLLICMVSGLIPTASPAAPARPSDSQNAACEAAVSPKIFVHSLLESRLEIQAPLEDVLRDVSRWLDRHARSTAKSSGQIPTGEFTPDKLISGLHWDFENKVFVDSVFTTSPPRRLAIRISGKNGSNATQYTDLALTDSGTSTIVRTSSWLEKESVGYSASSRLDFVPVSIVSELIHGYGLRAEATLYDEASAERLAERILTNPSRYPLVYVSAVERQGRPAIDVNFLAQQLVGIAEVVSESQPLRRQLEQYLPNDALVWNGGIRIYPRGGVGPKQTAGLKSHKVAQEKDVRNLVSAITRMILTEQFDEPLTGNKTDNNEAWNYDLLEEEIQEASPEAQLSRARERLKVLEHTSAEQKAQLEADLRDARAELALHQERADNAERRASELEENLAVISDELSQAHAALGRISQVPSGAHDLSALFTALSRLPGTVHEAVTTAEQLFGSRIVFTDRAHRSARATAYTDVASVWSALVAMSSSLYDIYFKTDGSVDVRREFHARSGHDIALSEGNATNANPRMAAQRQDTYLGRTIDVSAHVRLEKRGQHLRIHFYVDRETKRIVISHVGDHLDTLGTQRM